jgi:hypothetical protein
VVRSGLSTFFFFVQMEERQKEFDDIYATHVPRGWQVT